MFDSFHSSSFVIKGGQDLYPHLVVLGRILYPVCLPYQTFPMSSTFELPPLPVVKDFGFPRQHNPCKGPEAPTRRTQEEVGILFDLINTWAGVTGKAEWCQSIHTPPTGLGSIHGEE